MMILSKKTILLAGLVALLASVSLASAWTGPTASPPSNNTATPLNVSSTAQVKNGNIGVNGLAVFGNSILQASSYLNWGATAGSAGYGVRDNAGTLEFKNSGGSWASIQSTVATLGGVSGSGTAGYIPRFTSSTALGNSSIADNGSSATANGNLFVNGTIYDGTNNAYYLDPSSSSNLSSVTANNILTVKGVGSNWAETVNWPNTSAPSGSFGILVGSSASGYSQFQNANGNYAQLARSDWGVYTQSSGYGVYGQGSNTGVEGVTSGGSGGWGVQGIGNNSSGNGVYGQGTNVPIEGYNSSNGIYGYVGYSSYSFYGNGALYISGNANAAAFLYNSDERLKKNITPLTDNLAKVLQIEPVSYLWKDAARGTGPQIGFIAQNVQKVAPEIVHTDASTTLEAVDYARITPLLVGSVQELNQKVESQQQQIDTQQKEIEDLKAQIKAIVRTQ